MSRPPVVPSSNGWRAASCRALPRWSRLRGRVSPTLPKARDSSSRHLPERLDGAPVAGRCAHTEGALDRHVVELRSPVAVGAMEVDLRARSMPAVGPALHGTEC